MASAGTDIAVEVRNLVKRYPKRPDNAVDDLTFNVTRGEVFGLLGPNGAGKTTTVGVLTTRVRATSGSAQVAGIDVTRNPAGARSRLAVVPQRSNLDRSLTPRQNLEFHAAYHGVPRNDRRARAADLLDRFGLADRASDRVDFFSGGMAQRLMIARALMHTPDVLFLDEPTGGLDPQSRLFLWDQVRQMRTQGITIMLTTHDMDEAADLCDRIGIVDHGRLLALDTPAALTKGISGQSMLDLTVLPSSDDHIGQIVVALEKLAGVIRVERVRTTTGAGGGGGGGGAGGGSGAGNRGSGDAKRLADSPAGGRKGGRTGKRHSAARASATPVTVPTEVRLRLHVAAEPAGLLPPVVAELAGSGATLSDVRVAAPTLQDVFIGLTGRELR